MNNKGQSLVVFVLILPLILGFAAFSVDSGIMLYEKNKLDSISELASKTAINEYPDFSLERLRDLVKKNDPAVTNISMDVKNKKIEIILEKKIPSIFGQIIGFKEYNIKSHITKDLNK